MYEERSVWRAKSIGSTDHFGWSTHTYLLAALVDAMHTQLKGKKLTPIQQVSRPEIVKPEEAKPKFDLSKGVKNADVSLLFPF